MRAQAEALCGDARRELRCLPPMPGSTTRDAAKAGATEAAPERLADAVRLLEERGYVGAFRADGERLRERRSGRSFRARDLVVDEAFRFEGVSDPDDEAVVFALRDPKEGIRGTYTVAFGPGMDPLDGEQVRELRDARDG